jgi:hypothetical protein
MYRVWPPCRQAPRSMAQAGLLGGRKNCPATVTQLRNVTEWQSGPVLIRFVLADPAGSLLWRLIGHRTS